MVPLQEDEGVLLFGTAPLGGYVAVAFWKSTDVKGTIGVINQMRANLELPEGVALCKGNPAERVTDVRRRKSH